MNNTNTTSMSTIHNTARACAQGWAEQANPESPRRWAGDGVPDADIDYVEHEILGRPMSDEEAAEFYRVFIDEYAFCMQQRAERNGWEP